MDDDPDEPPVQARHLLLCEGVDYDPSRYGAPYSLGGLVEAIRPDDDIGYPLVKENYFTLFAQLHGRAGSYRVTVDLVRLDGDAADEDTWVASFGPFPIRVRAGRFVQGVPIPLASVPFDVPGLYEFRLFLDGWDTLLVAERLLLEA